MVLIGAKNDPMKYNTTECITRYATILFLEQFRVLFKIVQTHSYAHSNIGACINLSSRTSFWLDTPYSHIVFAQGSM